MKLRLPRCYALRRSVVGQLAHFKLTLLVLRSPRYFAPRRSVVGQLAHFKLTLLVLTSPRYFAPRRSVVGQLAHFKLTLLVLTSPRCFTPHDDGKSRLEYRQGTIFCRVGWLFRYGCGLRDSYANPPYMVCRRSACAFQADIYGIEITMSLCSSR